MQKFSLPLASDARSIAIVQIESSLEERLSTAAPLPASARYQTTPSEFASKLLMRAWLPGLQGLLR
jgi:hypothetical protein